ncbi:hypothetical protein ISN45_Aa05g006950 [Arabidopsis thaliana x Arabidopsis arenosa]|uniref:Uncharacterized protein n=1 Tax=Arabidopsis thaliana x Arabidopsis arenosa TaxID=1240361 RepID=A0A8T1ZI15_9BRAS|nr:hypothetical protein ISN45_Aa05g006950 [Arabidopsis thaliana x Arabidopsis arenosa]
MEEESDKTTALKKAYAEMILNTAKESAARVIVSERKSARFHHDLHGTKEEALRLLVRLKLMIDAKTIEAEITSSNQQRQIDVLEAQLQEAEDIITDLRSELRWVRDKLEKARNVVNMEQETISAPEVVVGNVYQSSLNDDECCGNETISATEVVASDSLLNQSSLYDDGCGNDGLSVNTSKVCESELDANIGNKKLELSRNGCTQRIHALESKASASASEEERRITEKDSEENLSSGNTRCLVLALRAKNAEVIPIKPSNSLVIKKSRKLQGRRKTRWSKRIAKLDKSQSQLIRPCLSYSDIPWSKTSVETSDGEVSMDTHLSVENEEVDALINACKGLEEHLQHNVDGIGFIREGKRSKNVEILGGISSPVNPTDHMVEVCQEFNLGSINVEDGEKKAELPENETKINPFPHLDPALTSIKSNVDPTSGSKHATVISVNATNRSTDKDLKSRKEDVLVKCEGEEDSVGPTTKMGYELVNPCSELKATTVVVSDQTSESPRTDGNRLVKYTFQRKRKRDL